MAGTLSYWSTDINVCVKAKTSSLCMKVPTQFPMFMFYVSTIQTLLWNHNNQNTSMLMSTARTHGKLMTSLFSEENTKSFNIL